MKRKSSWLRLMQPRMIGLMLVVLLVFTLGFAPFATAQRYPDGGGWYVPAYAPYTAGPVVVETPYAAYTPAQIESYAPYTAGPVVAEEPRVVGDRIGNVPLK